MGMLSLSQARSLPLIVLCSSLPGLTGELYRPASSALLADLMPAGLHGTRMDNSLRETWNVLRTDLRFRRMLCASLAVGLVFVQVFSTMSLEITRNGFSPSIYGLVISLNGVLIVLCELPLTILTKRYPARQMMALGYLLIGAGSASTVLGQRPETATRAIGSQPPA